MMPGMGGLADAANIDESVFDRQHALYDSMTVKERLHPDSIDVSRRRRIARGAGQDMSAVNELLKGFRAMQKMMKQMGKMGLGAKMGSKQKRAALEGMGGSGAGLEGGGIGGMLGGAGDMLGGLFGGGKGGAAPSMEDLQDMMPGGARPMGSSNTRSNAQKKKEKARKKRKKQKKRR
jgi:signal recognition particle subunit SRP54